MISVITRWLINLYIQQDLLLHIQLFDLFSWLSQRYFRFSVRDTRLMFITLEPSSVNSIYYPSRWEAKHLGVIFYTFFRFILYIQCIKSSNLFHFLVESTLVWFTQCLLYLHQICLPYTFKDDRLKITFIFLCSWDFSWHLASVRQMNLCEFGKWEVAAVYEKYRPSSKHVEEMIRFSGAAMAGVVLSGP